MESLKEKIPQLLKLSSGRSPEEIIKLAHEQFGQRVNFASSLGEEDQVITDMIAKVAPDIEIFTLDTGRLYPETYSLLSKIRERYKLNYKIYFPDANHVEKMVQEKGVNLFYESIENRKLCCHVRKVEPLQRALKNVDAWICGLRKDQGVTRQDIQMFDWDDANKKIKISPLAHWSLDDVHTYITKNNVQVNPLHAKGFLSIGCQPCTRAVKPGEDIRAGRWWWEQPDQKECGLHFKKKD